MNSKKKIVILGMALFIVVLVIMGVFLFLPKKAKYDYTDWQSYIKSYYDKTEKIEGKEEKLYTNEFSLKEKKLQSKDGSFILENILNIHIISYKEVSFLYAVDTEGKLYYINNIRNSTSEKYEVTELGDYTNIVKIENKNDQIIATDIQDKTHNISANMESYIHYAFQ